jgi:hypothetical protein
MSCASSVAGSGRSSVSIGALGSVRSTEATDGAAASWGAFSPADDV